MTLNEEFMKVLSVEIEEKNNLLVLHKCLMKFKKYYGYRISYQNIQHYRNRTQDSCYLN